MWCWQVVANPQIHRHRAGPDTIQRQVNKPLTFGSALESLDQFVCVFGIDILSSFESKLGQ